MVALGAFATQHRQSLFGALFNGMLPAAVPQRALDGLHAFGRYINELEHNARHTHGAGQALAFLHQWLKDIGYEQHLYDSEDSEQRAAARWSNVLEFCDWMAQRAGAQIDEQTGATRPDHPRKILLAVSQTIALLSTISGHEKEQDMVTLSTLHAAKGLEWPHVILAGLPEIRLAFKIDDAEGRRQPLGDDMLARLQEEPRLMYVGITRAQRTLAVSWSRQRKKGRDTVAAQPSRFIADMELDKNTTREDPRAKLKALRAEFAAKTQAAQATQATQAAHAAPPAVRLPVTALFLIAQSDHATTASSPHDPPCRRPGADTRGAAPRAVPAQRRAARRACPRSPPPQPQGPTAASGAAAARCPATPRHAWPALTHGPRSRTGRRPAPPPPPTVQMAVQIIQTIPPLPPPPHPPSPSTPPPPTPRPPGGRPPPPPGQRRRRPRRLPRPAVQRPDAVLGTGVGQRLRHLQLPWLPADHRVDRGSERRGPPAPVGRRGQLAHPIHPLPPHRKPDPALGAHQAGPRPAHPELAHAQGLAVVRLHPAVVLATVHARHLAPLSHHRPRTRTDLRLPEHGAATAWLALALQRHWTGAPVQWPEQAPVAQLEPGLPDDRHRIGPALERQRPHLGAHPGKRGQR